MEAPDGWTVWSEGDRRVVLAFRPDVFDGGAVPPACLPTIYLSRGRRSRRPGRREPSADDPWVVTLFLEPEVHLDPAEYDSRPAAVEGALELAAAFAAGEVDYRACYQVPREAYFERLDELVGER